MTSLAKKDFRVVWILMEVVWEVWEAWVVSVLILVTSLASSLELPMLNRLSINMEVMRVLEECLVVFILALEVVQEWEVSRDFLVVSSSRVATPVLPLVERDRNPRFRTLPLNVLWRYHSVISTVE